MAALPSAEGAHAAFVAVPFGVGLTTLLFSIGYGIFMRPLPLPEGERVVAITFANIAMDLVRDDVSGRMAAIQDGKYTHAPLPDPKAGPRRVDIAHLYNLERFRPHYSEKLGTPMFLSAERT